MESKIQVRLLIEDELVKMTCKCYNKGLLVYLSFKSLAQLGHLKPCHTDGQRIYICPAEGQGLKRTKAPKELSQNIQSLFKNAPAT